MASETDPLIQRNQLSLGTQGTVGSTYHHQSHPNEAPLHYTKTYTAGEDASRLAAAAKELGLAKLRNPRPQVRSLVELDQEVILPILAELHFPKTKKKKELNMAETIAGVAGNVLEWFDFSVYGYFGDILGQVFFPPHEESSHQATMLSFAVFGGAFLMRPVGGLFLGYLGDVYGRKQALTTSIFLMAFPTFAMGCLPSYAQVGYWSTASLIIIRLLQGMSVGGQLMSSLVFTLENVPTSQWGLYGSFVFATGNFGVLLGGLVGTAVRSSFTYEQLVAYGWRIPFLSGVIVSAAGFYLKWTESQKEDEGDDEEEGDDDVDDTNNANANTTVNDLENSTPPPNDLTTTAKIHKQKNKSSKDSVNNKTTNVLWLVFSPKNIRPLLAAAMVPMLWSSGFYLSFVWMAIYMTDLIDTPVPGAFAVNSVALLLSVCLLFPVAGWLSDLYGRRTIMSIGGTSIALLCPTLIRIIGQGVWYYSFGAQLFLGICLSFWGSPMCAWLVESFEPEARLTSVAVGYNAAHAIVGGFTPAVATYLVDVAGPTSPGWIYTVIACIAMTGLLVVAPRR